MRRHNQKSVSPRRRKAAPLNLLDLSEPKQRRSGGLYWTMLVSMIAAYGTYMATIANMERASGILPDHRQNEHASLSTESDIGALEKTDREPIVISVPSLPENITEQAPAALPKMTDRLPQRDSDSEPPTEEPQNTVEPEGPAPEEPPAVVHAMTSNKVSPAARAILRRIHAAASHGGNRTALADASDALAAGLAANTEPPPPLPVRRPYIASEIASHQLSSQNGTRFTRPQRPSGIPAKILSYRASVRAHLAAHRPSGGFGSGRVSLSFRLSADGKVSSAQVIRAPAAEDLDKRALSALYHAVPFPAAPEDAAGKHRAFTVSFVFE